MAKLTKFSKFNPVKKTKEGHVIIHPDDIGIRSGVKEEREVKKTKEGHVIIHPDDIGFSE